MGPELAVTSEEKYSHVIADSSRKKSLGVVKEGMEKSFYRPLAHLDYHALFWFSE